MAVEKSSAAFLEEVKLYASQKEHLQKQVWSVSIFLIGWIMIKMLIHNTSMLSRLMSAKDCGLKYCAYARKHQKIRIKRERKRRCIIFCPPLG